MKESDVHTTWFREEQPSGNALDELARGHAPTQRAWHERVDLMAPSPLQLTVSWRSHILTLSTLHTPHTFTLGSAPECDIVCAHEAFAHDEMWSMPLLSEHDGDWALHVHAALVTTFHRDTQQVCLQGVFSRRLLDEGVMLLSLTHLIEDQGHFHVRAGELDVMIERVARAPRAPLHAPLDAAPLPYLGLSTALHMALMLMLLTLPEGIDKLQAELEAPHAPRFVRAVVVSPHMPPLREQPELDDAPEQYDLQGDGVDAAIGGQHMKREGKAGRTVPVTHAQRLSVKERDDAPREERVAAARQSPIPFILAETGALAALTGHSDLLGAADLTQGDASHDHLGNVRNTSPGDAQGSFGMGIVGVGAGGGSAHKSVGITLDAAMKRLKLGGQGVAPRLEKRGAKLDDLFLKYHDVDSTRLGCLSEDMVKRAIRRRRNQIRTCYEHHLVKNRSLAGRIAVELTIAQSGSIARIDVLEDTTGEPAIAECVAHKLDDLHFPAFSKCEAVVARYPFNFHPKQLMILP